MGNSYRDNCFEIFQPNSTTKMRVKKANSDEWLVGSPSEMRLIENPVSGQVTLDGTKVDLDTACFSIGAKDINGDDIYTGDVISVVKDGKCYVMIIEYAAPVVMGQVLFKEGRMALPEIIEIAKHSYIVGSFTKRKAKQIIGRH